MKEYMMIFRNETAENEAKPSDGQMQAVMKLWQDWIGGLAAKGKFVGTNRLLPEGRTIKPNKVVTDGPYIEGKEVIGGYLIVKADSMDEATKMAESCPGLTYGGNVEIRAVMAIETNAGSGKFLEEKVKA